jgi:hypothetical protein
MIGSLVGNNYKSSMIVVPLLDKDTRDRRARSTTAICRSRSKASARSTSRSKTEKEAPAVKIHVIGFAKLVGDLIDGLIHGALYFAVRRRGDRAR